MSHEIERRDFLVSLIVIPLGATVAGCGEDKGAGSDAGADASCDGIDGVSTEIFAHTHTICVTQAMLDEPPADGVVITTERVAETHTHTITLTAKQLTTLAKGSGLVNLDTSTNREHFHRFTLGFAGDMG